MYGNGVRTGTENTATLRESRINLILKISNTLIDFRSRKRHIADCMDSSAFGFMTVLVPFARVCIYTSDERNFTLFGVPSDFDGHLSIGLNEWTN